MKLNEQNDSTIHMYEVYTQQGETNNDLVTWGIGADPDGNYGNTFSLALQQQAEDFYNEAGQPSEEQFIKLLGPQWAYGAGICFEYIGMHDFNFAPGDYVGYGAAMGSDGTANSYVEGPFNSFEECWAGENTVEDPCTDFNQLNSTFQSQICDSQCPGPNAWCECCPEEEEIEPFVSPCDKVNGLPEYDYDKFCNNICENKADYEWPLDLGMGLFVAESSHCECCRDEGPKLPKPKPLSESFKSRFKKLAGIKK